MSPLTIGLRARRGSSTISAFDQCGLPRVHFGDTWEHVGVDVVDRIRAVLLLDPNVTGVELVGSRSSGIETALSDWDLQIEAIDVDELMATLPSLTAPLRPLAAQWDRLSSRPVYMLILPGGVKVDLFTDDRPQTSEPPWQPQSDNLKAIDAHFWDWILWLGGKQLRGRADLVDEELQKMHVHLLRRWEQPRFLAPSPVP